MDDVGVFNGGDDLDVALAVGAGLDVDVNGELKNQALKRPDGVLSIVDASGVERGYLVNVLPQ